MYMLQIAKYENVCPPYGLGPDCDSEERRTSTYQYANRNVPIPNEHSRQYTIQYIELHMKSSEVSALSAKLHALRVRATQQRTVVTSCARGRC
jgi:ribosomal 50S subunit-associated protein YjgA (DUF615 family)